MNYVATIIVLLGLIVFFSEEAKAPVIEEPSYSSPVIEFMEKCKEQGLYIYEIDNNIICSPKQRLI